MGYKTGHTEPTENDHKFAALVSGGMSKVKAFCIAYPESPAVIRFMGTPKGHKDYKKYYTQVQTRAFQIIQTERVGKTLDNYQEKMDEFSDLALKTATDLVKNARSEKVRADLAIEGIRHKVGNPTQKVLGHTEQVVTLTFSPPPEKKVIEHDESDF